ncbi:MAG TPA: T9SS type A sorting domain-containing protein [Flavisolibacter sp.]|nr:T9SS type A sorting domain-containing protein [Flavisolibacter sp.]
MKTIACTAVFWLLTIFEARSQDLPNPPSNVMNLPKGSLVIPMDNTYQLNSAGLFNLKAYGLVVSLLNKRVRIRWVIKSGKAKDGIDFTVASDLSKPTTTATGITRNFKAGPFVIFQQDTTGVGVLINAYYALYGLTGADRPNVYVTTNNVNVDVRYTVVAPKGAILTDGGNQNIHVGYMVAAGIPTQNYALSAGDNLTNCFSFASEPHNTNTGPLVDTAIAHIKKFVLLGGNFLAQCAAVSNYENNAYGRFQTTSGVTVANTNIGPTLLYPNPDLSYSQFEGAYFGYDGQSVVQNWQLSGVGINNYHNHATGSGAFTTNIVASVSKLTSSGGMVFYIGCHDYLAVAPSALTNNGLRMYMNAFLTPSTFTCPLPLSLISFSGSMNNNRPELHWTTGENETGDHFELQRSFDGIQFTLAAYIPVTAKEGLESYSYKEQAMFTGTVYYRLKMVNKNFSEKLSKIIVLKDREGNASGKLSILENPVGAAVNLQYTAQTSTTAKAVIYNTSGGKIFETSVPVRSGNNIISMPLDAKIPAGMYILEIASSGERATARMIKK